MPGSLVRAPNRLPSKSAGKLARSDQYEIHLLVNLVFQFNLYVKKIS